MIAASKLPVVKGISFQIRQLFINLFSNSIKYRKEGRPLRIEISSAWISDPELAEADTYPPTRFLKVSVKDNGIGFDAEHNDRIFDMFQLLHTRENYSGMGIGLSICRRVMENHKGYIRAKGYPGEGAVFDLFFPE